MDIEARVMNLPENIKQEILDYLHLEYGEDPNGKYSLKLENILFEGEFLINGVTTHYFKFGRNEWVTVEPYGDSYMIGMTTFSPKPTKKKNLYNKLYIESFDKSFSTSIELGKIDEGFFGFPNYKKIEISDSEYIHVLVEANINIKPEQIVLSVKDHENDVYVKSSVYVEMKYKTCSGQTLFFSIGK